MRFVAVLLTASALWAMPAVAAEKGDADRGPLTITVNKAEILHLSAPAQRVIVANPAIADVTVEKPTLLTLFGKTVGETSLTVLGVDDQEVLSRTVVVTGAGDHTVTVHGPGAQGPVSRDYACVGQRCSKVGADGSTTTTTTEVPSTPPH